MNINIQNCIRQHFDVISEEGSTALGFSGIGCCAMTEANTVVIVDYNTNTASVFFGEKIAYSIKDINSIFIADVEKHMMPSVIQAKQKYKDIIM